MVGHNSAMYNIAPDAEPWLNQSQLPKIHL